MCSRPLTLMSMSMSTMATTSRSDAKPSLKTRLLGSSSLCVTEACLGTMTWGVQNSEADAHAQLDYAIKERGITMVDTAELYPVPLTSPEWRAGRTEEFIGTWLAANPEWREKIVLATKVCGYQRHSRVATARDAPPATELTNGEHNPDCRLDRASIHAACHASLKRLQTDYIDLYQATPPLPPLHQHGSERAFRLVASCTGPIGTCPSLARPSTALTRSGETPCQSRRVRRHCSHH